MNPRERIKAAIQYRPPDRLPCHDSFWQDTPTVWREQGMPADVSLEDFLIETGSISGCTVTGIPASCWTT